jgi:anaerobic selenocysteine-containing dehydrogenase
MISSPGTRRVRGLKADIEAASWDWIEASSGLSREAIESMAESMPRPKRHHLLWHGHHPASHGTQNVQAIANLLLLRGNFGRPGAGICPLRGHSNVQGDRTVGITELPDRGHARPADTAFGIRSRASMAIMRSRR